MKELVERSAILAMSMIESARADQPRRASLGGEAGPWWVYGAGKMGQKVAAALGLSGREVAGFIDAKKSGECEGLPILSPSQVVASGRQGLPVALGLHNPMVDASEFKNELAGLGFRSVWMPQELVEALGSISNFWLAPLASMDGLDLDAVKAALACYSDPESIEAALGILKWRLWSDSSGLPKHDAAGQYAPASLPPLPQPLRLIDCGAYTGDTLRSLRGQGLGVEAYVGLEPDPTNYAQLAIEARRGEGMCMALPCGAWSTAAVMKFAPDDAAGSVRVDGKGDIHIQMVSIDDALMSMRPNYIKMDIEGAEWEALKGAENCIESFAPRLAISSYHRPMDLWLLPIRMKSLMMQRDGRQPSMALRCHAMSSFDSVIYAWPSDDNQEKI